MPWRLTQGDFRGAVLVLIAKLGGRCALLGTVGVQAHLASRLGPDKLAPPARFIEVALFDGDVPDLADIPFPVKVVDCLGFDASIQAGTRTLDLSGDRFPVAAPEHILGLGLASPDLTPDVKFACFTLMRIFEGELDLEEARGILKRCAAEDRQALLAELAYLAA